MNMYILIGFLAGFFSKRIYRAYDKYIYNKYSKTFLFKKIKLYFTVFHSLRDSGRPYDLFNSFSILKWIVVFKLLGLFIYFLFNLKKAFLIYLVYDIIGILSTNSSENLLTLSILGHTAEELKTTSVILNTFNCIMYIHGLNINFPDLSSMIGILVGAKLGTKVINDVITVSGKTVLGLSIAVALISF